jgi:heme exporter protein A
MNIFRLYGKNISKSYTKKRKIFSGIDIELNNGQIKGIAGENGSGKTTLLKILSGLIQLSEGSIALSVNGRDINREEYYRHVGYVAPYLNVYEEFSPLEHIMISSRLQGLDFDYDSAASLLKKFNLFHRKNDLIKTFSSGMKQRMKYILSLTGHNEILLLDEPFTNLDEAGISAVKTIVEEHVSKGGSVIIASNDDREKSLCSQIISLK